MSPYPASPLDTPTPVHADAVAALHTAAADHLTSRYGKGPWSTRMSRKGALYAMRTTRMLVLRDDRAIVATLQLTAKRPWAIDVGYFTPCKRPIYLIGMAVHPDRQREGFGRRCLEAAFDIARHWPADAVRLDAYDAPAGAGPFYARCGFVERGRVTYRDTPLVYYEFVF